MAAESPERCEDLQRTARPEARGKARILSKFLPTETGGIPSGKLA
jgi:hypothetical protein